MAEIKKGDMTRGNAFRQILTFTVPIFLGNLFQQFYNIADMVIVGRTISPLAYAAVGSTGSLVWFASGAVQSLTVGFSAVTAHHFGSGDKEQIKRSFAVAIKLSAVISVLMAILCVALARPMLTLLRTPENLYEAAYAYIVWIFAGLVATALFNLLSNMIRALGPKLQALHIHDNDCRWDNHQIPFSMQIDYAPIIKALKEIGYGGWFTLEADKYLSAFDADSVSNGVKDLAASAHKLVQMWEGE